MSRIAERICFFIKANQRNLLTRSPRRRETRAQLSVIVAAVVLQSFCSCYFVSHLNESQQTRACLDIKRRLFDSSMDKRGAFHFNVIELTVSLMRSQTCTCSDIVWRTFGWMNQEFNGENELNVLKATSPPLKSDWLNCICAHRLLNFSHSFSHRNL